MHRIYSILPVIFCSFYLLFAGHAVYAQIDLDLLLNTPTPTPLPPGQEYILELEQLDLSTASDSGHMSSMTAFDREQFEKNGYTIISSDKDLSFSINRTQIAFRSFTTAPIQEEESVANITSEASGFQIVMEAQTGLKSTDKTAILPTRCDSRKTCSPLRASRWTDEKPTGWGYKLSGSSIPHDFQDGTFYRSPSLDGSVSLLKQGENTKNNTVTITWKIIADAAGDETYSSIVRLFALPY